MRQLKKILIVGGGSAGWMAAALFSRLFRGLYDITLIESEAIGTVGVGEATIPAIKTFNALIGLDEVDFMRRTQASFKLGIQFIDWDRIGSSYIHGFGVIGRDLEWLRCHQYWLKMRAAGRASDFAAYSINTAAALQNRFMRADPQRNGSPLGHIAHAFHFDAGLYAKYLRGLSEAAGVRRREGKIASVQLRPDDGFVQSVTMEDGAVEAADLFIDCSGFRGLIIEEAMKTGYEDWTHWLPCDRALAVPCARTEPFTPYTRATARPAGWQWRIPLQHRTGNGHVYSSRYMDEAEAERILLSNLDGEQLAEPNRIRFVAGKRRQVWNKNCVAAGLASGFLEPLESTSLHLIQSVLTRLVRLMPDGGFDPTTIAEFNRQMDFEYERIRDFVILHYKATYRDDTPFWRDCRDMAVPDTLQRKMDLFRANGRVFREDDELFTEESWIQVFLGQGVIPAGYDPLVDVTPEAEIERFLNDVETVIGKCVAVMPSHADYVARVCSAVAA
ncbi:MULTISPECIES: tryptophan halogenase family protein [unclassified Brevundimonas]|uniref:tryptophan halogenase family protein n=1 Tax=unclassified Brevundimonas TaxID=2622653 RepID=UPI00128FC199|nr:MULTISPECIES: tryptophan halogenase family protein [unclassified Brevundimonas]MBJ7510265.1 tryptophan 7-halogenase [Brevundimonas sp.]QFU31580.1 Flavin-dependent tryptophan halogenase RebH [Brevundimonas sp. Bb-A]